jgi:hypothetical protein
MALLVGVAGAHRLSGYGWPVHSVRSQWVKAVGGLDGGSCQITS